MAVLPVLLHKSNRLFKFKSTESGPVTGSLLFFLFVLPTLRIFARMAQPVLHYIQQRLRDREATSSLRKLGYPSGGADFCSNDYLGFARSVELREDIHRASFDYPERTNGSTGSRLISGNDAFAEDLEHEIADFHGAASGLLFHSGYAANVGLFSCLPQKGDTVITDELIHASVIDGIRLSLAHRYTFRHNDVDHLEEKLKRASGKRFIAVESVYSMDGDCAPLREIAALARRYDAALIVDEAHATGIFGPSGEGLVAGLQLEPDVFARVVTFGKALGCHGAIVLGPMPLRDYLVNFARSFIYSTAPSFLSHLSVRQAYRYLLRQPFQTMIDERIQAFRSMTGGLEGLIDSQSPIQSLVIGGNTRTREIASDLQKSGLDVRAILSPTVPTGKERIRICLHTYNTDNELRTLAQRLQSR